MNIPSVNNDILSEYITSGQSNKMTQLENSLSSVEAGKDDEALKKACKDFEAYFMTMMLKEMRKSIPDGGLMPKSQATQIYEDMLYEEYSNEASTGDGIGLAKALYEQLSDQTAATRKNIHED